ncbi:hypothetical protein GCM10010278_66230 [Streptomyces melanogenes]|nr:hypothetical protein GCM10010278_66230 [Streptomyces melanogenes]
MTQQAESPLVAPNQGPGNRRPAAASARVVGEVKGAVAGMPDARALPASRHGREGARRTSAAGQLHGRALGAGDLFRGGREAPWFAYMKSSRSRTGSEDWDIR